MCSHHGSRCPIFLRVWADKVTELIDVSLQSPSLCTGSTPISISSSAGEESACGGTRGTANAPADHLICLCHEGGRALCIHSLVRPGSVTWICGPSYIKLPTVENLQRVRQLAASACYHCIHQFVYSGQCGVTPLFAKNWCQHGRNSGSH